VQGQLPCGSRTCRAAAIASDQGVRISASAWHTDLARASSNPTSAGLDHACSNICRLSESPRASPFLASSRIFSGSVNARSMPLVKRRQAMACGMLEYPGTLGQHSRNDSTGNGEEEMEKSEDVPDGQEPGD